MGENQENLTVRAKQVACVVVSWSSILLLLPSNVYADMAVPVIFLTVPAMLVALLPITWVETAIIAQHLQLGWRQLSWRIGLANFVSTVVGLPFAWFLLNLVLTIPGARGSQAADTFLGTVWGGLRQATWLYGGGDNLRAVLASFLPALVLSVGIEGALLKGMLDAGHGKVWKAVWRANLASYALLVLVVVGLWVYGMISGRVII